MCTSVNFVVEFRVVIVCLQEKIAVLDALTLTKKFGITSTFSGQDFETSRPMKHAQTLKFRFFHVEKKVPSWSNHYQFLSVLILFTTANKSTIVDCCRKFHWLHATTASAASNHKQFIPKQNLAQGIVESISFKLAYINRLTVGATLVFINNNVCRYRLFSSSWTKFKSRVSRFPLACVCWSQGKHIMSLILRSSTYKPTIAARLELP